MPGIHAISLPFFFQLFFLLSHYLLSFAIPISCYKAFRNDDWPGRVPKAPEMLIDSRREIRKVTLVNVLATSQG